MLIYTWKTAKINWKFYRQPHHQPHPPHPDENHHPNEEPELNHPDELYDELECHDDELDQLTNEDKLIVL